MNIEDQEGDGLTRYHNIKQYLEGHPFPEHATKKDRVTIKRLAMQYTLGVGQLYRWSYNQVLLRCVDKAEASTLMFEVHGGLCGTHMNGVMLAK